LYLAKIGRSAKVSVIISLPTPLQETVKKPAIAEAFSIHQTGSGRNIDFGIPGKIIFLPKRAYPLALVL
jgi:hypothetical protein